MRTESKKKTLESGYGRARKNKLVIKRRELKSEMTTNNLTSIEGRGSGY